MSPIECTPAKVGDIINSGGNEGVYFKYSDGSKHMPYVVGVDMSADVIGYPNKGGLVNNIYREPGWWGLFNGMWFHSTED